jgi:cytidine deaminase
VTQPADRDDDFPVLTEPDIRVLIKVANNTRRIAYAPYSGYRVGAALVGASGLVYSGCNVENASFGLTICAERSAVAAAVAAGEVHFQAVAVVTDAAEPVAPCGACRQVLAEFEPALQVWAEGGGAQAGWRLDQLLPQPFRDVPGRQR